MPERDGRTEQFEANRAHLRAVAYRMLGSLSEAEDAVQETWLHLNRADTSSVENLTGWLTTVVARICLNTLRTRRARREESFDVLHVPDPIISHVDGTDPEQEALLADAVGLALMVVLDTLTPAERLAFVLHDMFTVPFDEIALIVDRTPTATRQLASRARRRVQDAAPTPDPDLTRQREVVDAFYAASRNGDFDALVAVLDPNVILRSDGGQARPSLNLVIRGARNVAAQARLGGRLYPYLKPALINGTAGAVVATPGRPLSVMSFTVAHGQIVAIDVLADPARLANLDLTVLDLAP